MSRTSYLPTNLGDEFVSAPVSLNRSAKVVSSRGFRPLKPFMRMPFGPHQGKTVSEVPADYLLTLKDDERVERIWPAVADYVRRNETALMEAATTPVAVG